MSDEAMVATSSREADQLAMRDDVERLSAEPGVAVHAMGDMHSRRAGIAGCAALC